MVEREHDVCEMFCSAPFFQTSLPQEQQGERKGKREQTARRFIEKKQTGTSNASKIEQARQ